MKNLKVVLLLYLLILGFDKNQHAYGNSKPNVIVIITDDQGYGEISLNGNPILETPNLDELAKGSVRLDDFHVAPMCAPTRGQLLTGMDAVRNGLVNVSSGRALLKPELPTMGSIFSSNGYTTGVFGKWHLGDNYPYRPQDRGFQESVWFPSSHIGSLPDYWGNDYFDDVYWNNGERKRFEGYCTDVFFTEAKDFIRNSIDEKKPFFAYISTNTPHYPFNAKEEDLEVLRKAYTESAFASDKKLGETLIPYLAMIRNIDTNVGELLNFLEMQKVIDNTIIIFLTDNGSIQGYRYFNANMRGAKCELWDGGHRVPCYIRWDKGNFKKTNTDVTGLTQVQDILPTLVDLCGLSQTTPTQFDGISLSSALSGKSSVSKERMLFINYSRMPNFIDFPAPFGQTMVRKEGAAVLWKDWRLLENRELYNRTTDPLQEENVYDQYPEIVGVMEKGLDQWWGKVKDEVNELQKIIIGSNEENPMMLTACDWVDVFVDQQPQISRGVRKNSYWCLEVAKEGEYVFELRRWPEETDSPIKGTCEMEDREGQIGGKALPIQRASIYIGGVNHLSVDNKKPYQFEGLSKRIDSEDKSVSFKVHLDPGPVFLHTFFSLPEEEGTIGSYFVYVNRE